MYATPPPPGAGAPPGVSSASHPAQALPSGHPATAAPLGADAFGTDAQSAVAWAQPVPIWNAAPVPAPARSIATQLTGAYASSGDAGIDRMLALEAACKRFGSLQ